jgi:hypothetical protein
MPKRNDLYIDRKASGHCAVLPPSYTTWSRVHGTFGRDREGSDSNGSVVSWCGVQDDQIKGLKDSHHSRKLVEEAIFWRAERGIQLCSHVYATWYSVILEHNAGILEDAIPWFG